MKVNTQSVNFNADKKLIDFIQKRMDKLDLFYDKVIQLMDAAKSAGFDRVSLSLIGGEA